MADVFKMKVGTNTNMGLRNIGHIDSSSLARLAESRRDLSGSGGTGEYIFYFTSFDRSNTLGYGVGTSTIPEDFEQIFNYYSGFRAYINNEMKTRLAGEFGAQYERGLREGDGILIVDPAMTSSVNYYFKYTDLRTVQKLTYKGYPVFSVKKGNVVTFQRQYLNGMPPKVSISRKTATSIIYRIENDEYLEPDLQAKIFAWHGLSTNPATVSSLYSSGSHPTGLLNNSYYKLLIPKNSMQDYGFNGLSPNTEYKLITLFGQQSTSEKGILHSKEAILTSTTNSPPSLAFHSKTSSSLTVRITNNTGAAFRNVAQSLSSSGPWGTTSYSISDGSHLDITRGGLGPYTSYNFYIRGNCDGTTIPTTPSYISERTDLGTMDISFQSSTSNSITVKITNNTGAQLGTLMYRPSGSGTWRSLGSQTISNGNSSNISIESLDPSTSYTFYFRGTAASKTIISTPTYITASTQSIVLAPSFLTTGQDPNFCVARFQVKNNNSFPVTLFVRQQYPSTSTYENKGTLNAGESNSFSISGDPGTNITAQAYFSSSYGSSSTSSRTVTVSNTCIPL